ncbi:MAG: phytanoyl-CoA dioxygenase family protein [Candidatus Omnitrophica bacterium]|nr:phytanoyl-CoA dioxygenase family protein [Candidatus Omnitrophota bacterium]
MDAVLQRVKTGYRRLAARYPALDTFRPNRLVFGNIRPMRQNLRYLQYWRECRRVHPGGDGAAAGPVVQEAVRKLRTDGYYIFPPQDPGLVQTIAQKVERLAAAGQTSVDELEPWMIQISHCVRDVPEIFQFLRPEIVATLEAAFRSHFKIYSAEIYRLVPTERSMEASGLWHTDNYPPAVLKAMVYLTDCDQTSGALRIHPWPGTRRLLRSGFFDRYQSERFADRLNRGWVAMEGRAGSVVLWNSNVVHRATPPKGAIRDAAAFKFLPSKEPWDRHLARVGEGVSYERRNRAVPDDPSAD